MKPKISSYKCPINWSSFVDSNWNSGISVLKDIINEPIITENELFIGIIDTISYCRKNSINLQWLRLYDSKGIEIIENKTHLLPNSKDENFNQYESRLSRINGFDKFGLVLYDLEIYSEAGLNAWKLLTPFREQIVNNVNYFNMHAFIGNYDYTPFGVHTDPVRTFISHIKGEKKLWFWDLNEWLSYKRPLGTNFFVDKLQNAKTVELRKNDLIYFTPDFPHIGKSLGLTISVTMDFWTKKRKFPPGTLRGENITMNYFSNLIEF